MIVVFVRSILFSRICDPPPCRCRSPASGSKASRTTLYCRHADSAAADEKYFCAPVELESSSGCPALHPDGFALQTYVPADCESRRNVWRMRTAGEGGLSHVFASRAAVPHPAAHLAAAIVPRRREKSDRHQSGPLGKPISPAIHTVQWFALPGDDGKIGRTSKYL